MLTASSGTLNSSIPYHTASRKSPSAVGLSGQNFDPLVLGEISTQHAHFPPSKRSGGTLLASPAMVYIAIVVIYGLQNTAVTVFLNRNCNFASKLMATETAVL